FFLRLLLHLSSPLFPYTTLFRSTTAVSPHPRRHAHLDHHGCSGDGGRSTVQHDRRSFNVTPVHHLDRCPIQKQLEHTGFDSKHQDRKSTRLNSSHVSISYAVFCL